MEKSDTGLPRLIMQEIPRKTGPMDKDQDERKSLADALAAAGAKTDADSLDRVHKKLWRIRWKYIHPICKNIPAGGGTPSKKLLRVNKALIEWLGPPYSESYGQAYTV